MRSGELSNKDLIVEAIEEAQRRSGGEVRVHISRRWMEKDARARASRVFVEFGLGRNPRRNSVLIYVNLRRRKLAVVCGAAVLEAAGRDFWERVARDLGADLRATHPENAIALAVARIGDELALHFPAAESPAPAATGEV